MIFESLDALSRACGEPAMPLERCSICSAIPDRCSREVVTSIVSDYDVDYGDERFGPDNVPPQVSAREVHRWVKALDVNLGKVTSTT